MTESTFRGQVRERLRIHAQWFATPAEEKSENEALDAIVQLIESEIKKREMNVLGIVEGDDVSAEPRWFKAVDLGRLEWDLFGGSEKWQAEQRSKLEERE